MKYSIEWKRISSNENIILSENYFYRMNFFFFLSNENIFYRMKYIFYRVKKKKKIIECRYIFYRI